jgi:hypothetical protein
MVGTTAVALSEPDSLFLLVTTHDRPRPLPWPESHAAGDPPADGLGQFLRPRPAALQPTRPLGHLRGHRLDVFRLTGRNV